MGEGIELIVLVLALSCAAYLGLGLGTDGLVIVEVKIAKRHHRQYSTRVNLHTDCRRAVLDVVVLHGLGEVLFNVILDDGVNGEAYAVAVAGVYIVLVARVEHIRARRGGRAHDIAALAREHAVIAGFYTAETGVVQSHEADDVRGHAAVGVIALCVGLDLDAYVAAVGFELPYLLGHVLLHLAGHDLVPGVRVPRLFEDGLVVHAEDLGETARDGLLVLVVALYLGGAYVHGIHARAHGEHYAVAVIYRASRGAYRGLAHLLGDRRSLVLVVLHYLDLVQPRAEHQKSSYAAHR